MQSFSEFHDGSFDGILVQGSTAFIFVSTYEKVRYVLVARGVLALSADEIMSGNIILDVSTRSAMEVTADELATRARIRPPYSSAGIDAKLLERAREQNLIVLTIDPSYGGTCIIMAESFDRIMHEEWRSARF